MSGTLADAAPGRNPPVSDGAGKRQWFQFSLGTLLLLVVSAGALLGLNLREREILAFKRHPSGAYEAILFSVYGWPFPIRYSAQLMGSVSPGFAEEALRRGVVGLADGDLRKQYSTEEYQSRLGDAAQLEGGRITLDVMTAVLILACVAFLSERVVCARKTTEA